MEGNGERLERNKLKYVTLSLFPSLTFSLTKVTLEMLRFLNSIVCYASVSQSEHLFSQEVSDWHELSPHR